MPDFNILDNLKQRLDSCRPLPPEIVANLHEDLVLRRTYNSNAIEGNTLTLKETQVTLEGLMNLELMKEGYPPVILPVEKRLEYYDALDAAHTKQDYEPFLALIAEVVEAGFKPYWLALGVHQ